MIKSKLVVTVGCSLLLATAITVMPNLFYINSTPSVPIGLYMRIPGKDYGRGDYIVYEPDEATQSLVRHYEWHEKEPSTYLKIVGGVAVDTYTIDKDNGQFTVAGKYVGQALDCDSKGNPLPQHRGEFTVEPGRILPIARNPRSFDGRYTGTIPVASIKAKVIPLLTR